MSLLNNTALDGICGIYNFIYSFEHNYRSILAYPKNFLFNLVTQKFTEGTLFTKPAKKRLIFALISTVPKEK